MQAGREHQCVLRWGGLAASAGMDLQSWQQLGDTPNVQGVQSNIAEWQNRKPLQALVRTSPRSWLGTGSSAKPMLFETGAPSLRIWSPTGQGLLHVHSQNSAERAPPSCIRAGLGASTIRWKKLLRGNSKFGRRASKRSEGVVVVGRALRSLASRSL